MSRLVAIADPPGRGGTAAVLGSLRSQRSWLSARGWELGIVRYGDLERDLEPSLDEAVCLLYFPYTFWDRRVEGVLPDLYGTGAYGTLLRDHLLAAGELVRTVMPNARFVNTPRSVAVSRDKRLVKRRLLEAGVPTPASHPAVSLPDLVAEGHRLYVKAPHASMGKGITVLSPGSWRTNYLFDGVRLRRQQGESWPFHEIRVGTVAFLDALRSQGDFLIEEAVSVPGSGDRCELRVTAAAGQVLRVDRCLLAAGDATAAETGRWERDVRVWDTAVAGTAHAACAALDLDYAVFDMVLDRAGTPFVVDVQAFPALDTGPGLHRDLLALLLTSVGSRT